jgi:CheY-like chemotaxis protein
VTKSSAHTVLIVEDEEDLRELMQTALESRGYAVVTAEEGGEALLKLEHLERPCLVLLDLLMPGMNGWEFYTKMRERPSLEGIPVIVHSSASDRAPAGVTQVIQKPITFDRLLAVVSKYCAASPS